MTTSCQGRLAGWPDGSIRCTACGEVVYGLRRTAKPAQRGEELPRGIKKKKRR